MSDDEVIKSERNLPHWFHSGSIHFVTFRLKTGVMTSEEQQIVFDHIKSGDDQFYQLVAVTVMPDHVHMLLRINPPYDLSRVMKGIKGKSARLVNQRRNTLGMLWQDESWDRLMRDPREFEMTLEYIINNASKAGLVRSTEEYPFAYCKRELL